MVLLIMFFIRKKIVFPIEMLLKAIIRIKEGYYDINFSNKQENELSELFLKIQQLGFSLDKTTVSKNYMERIMNSMIDMLIIIDNEGKILVVNEATKKNFDYSEQEIRSQKIFQVAEITNDLLANFKNSFSAEFFIKTKSNKKIPCLATITRMSDESNRNGDQILFIIKDMSEAVAHQQEKIEMQKQLFQNSKLVSIGELAQGIGHEINNPMTIINGYFKLIGKHLKNVADGDIITNKYLPAINESIVRINDIVKGLRYYSQADTESSSVINVNEILQNISLLIGGMYKKMNIELRLDLAPAISNCVGNAQKMQQIFTNLISNAKDAVDQRENPLIVLRTKDDGDNLIVEIEDNGVGIEESKLDKIFDAFYTTKEAGKGTGLGLSLVHSFVVQMRGSVKVFSQLSKGSIFVVSFPKANKIPIDEKEVAKS